MTEGGSNGNRRLPACERCRTRKTKCDSLLPSCSNCTKAGVECINEDRNLGRAYTRSYVWSLEERLRAAEEKTVDEEPQSKRPRLSTQTKEDRSQYQNESFDHPSSDSPSPENRSPQQQHTSSHTPAEHHMSTMDDLLVSTLSRKAASHVSDDLHRQIRQYPTIGDRNNDREVFIQNENTAIAKLGRDFLKQGRRNTTRNRTTDITAYDYPLLTRLARRYFRWMNSAHPVLHECMFHFRLEKCYHYPDEASTLDWFQVKMVIAIALASIGRPHLSTSEIGRIAHDFWKSATKTLNIALSGRGLQVLQNILLLLQYTLLVPKAGDLWQLSGSAMRFVTEMGLYAEPNPTQDFDALSLDLRRRVFWTCYCIDRMLATVMGRPTAISDSWITAKIPALVEDRLITVNGINSGPICQLKIAQIQQIRICRLQSEIHARLYAPSNQESTPETEWSWHMYDQLRLWRNTYSYSTPMITEEWTDLQFNISVVLLFRPSPNRPQPTNEALHVAFHSAGEAMKLVKVMHRDLSAVFSWLTVQNLFMCGLTFVNSLKELSEQSPGLCTSLVEVFLQIQSCSAMLETLSALETGANERIRNVFEMASSNILRNLGNWEQKSNDECIWAQIAKLDDLNLQRPVQIDGCSIPIQSISSVLQETAPHYSSNFYSQNNNDHFYFHDIDAVSNSDLLHASLDQSNYIPGHILPSRPGSVPPRTTDTDAIQLLDGDNGMDRMTAITNAAAEANPIRNTSINELPDWSETSLGAELERWFLYPFSDVSPPVSQVTSEQFSV